MAASSEEQAEPVSLTPSTSKPDHNTTFALTAICLLGIVKGLIFASLIPIWSPIDELQHFHYIKHVAETGTLPVLGETLVSEEDLALTARLHHMEKQGWPPYLESEPDPQNPLWFGTMSYEAWQPPLYYLLMVPFYLISGSDPVTTIHLLRAVNVVMGSLIAVFVYETARLVFPRANSIALGAALFAALMPGYRLRITTQIANDVMVEFFAAAVVLMTVKALITHWPGRAPLMAGVLLGLGVLTKNSAAFLFPSVLLAILLDAMVVKAGVRKPLRDSFIFALAFLVTILPLLVWNMVNYEALTTAGRMRQLMPTDIIPVPILSWDWFWRYGRRMLYNLWRFDGGASAAAPIAVSIAAVSLGCLLLKEFALRKEGCVRKIPLLVLFLAGATTIIGAFIAPIVGQVDAVEPRYLAPGIVPLSILFVAGVPSLIPSRYRRFWLIGLLLFVMCSNARLIVPTFLHYYSFNFYPRIDL